MQEQQETALHAWERKLLIAAFGAWAEVVAYMGQQVINRVDQVVVEMTRQADVNSEAHMLLDRRVTILEQQQQSMIDALNRINSHIDKELHNGGAP